MSIPSRDILIEDCDLDTPAHREVTEYPFYETRLKSIDYKAALEKDELFCDPEFPADLSSILDPNMPPHPHKAEWETFVWKRPSEVYGEGNFTLYEKASPDDIHQGKCGDCYFLAGLSALAENEGRIDKIIVPDFVNKQGCYAVRIYISGQLKEIVVDDRFPYSEKS